jgi:S-formylglutathione hydrolase FrmB
MRKVWAATAVVLCVSLVGSSSTLAQGVATAVTGTQACEMVAEGETSSLGSALQSLDARLACTDTMSDPRVSGTASNRFSWRQYGDHVVTWGVHELSGPEGGWVGPYFGRSNAEDPSTGSVLHAVLTGSGAYAGWTYVLDATTGAGGTVLEGLIYEGPPPTWESTASLAPEVAAQESPGPAATIGEPADDGARIVGVAQLDQRTVDLSIDSPAVGEVRTRLLLPAGFDPDAEADWPVLYLLHGARDDYTSWTRQTDVEEITADLDLIVVMPEAGTWGWYSDWDNGGQGGPPMWETFHLTELRQLLERNWQAGDERIVAGLSMGGFGAMSYAGRHPDVFAGAASFSGALHTLVPDFGVPDALWGSPAEQLDAWASHDPVSLAEALDGKTLYVSFGDGSPGPLDAEIDQEMADLEAWLEPQNEAFVARLEELGIPATVVAGAGTHTWPYWERGLHEALPLLLEAIEG